MPSQVHPSVRILRDTIYLAWVNLNENVSFTQDVFASILEWKVIDHTGLEQREDFRKAFTIYPNPARDGFYLQWEQEINGELAMTLYNASGMLIHEETLHFRGQEMKIDLPAFQEGMYYLKLDGESFHSALPLIIKR